MASFAIRKLLIIGARPGSLGDHLSLEARGKFGAYWSRVETAGINNEDIEFDITDSSDVSRVLHNTKYTDVICTVGASEHENGLVNTILINGAYPLLAMSEWATFARSTIVTHVSWVNISSNSAHIVRSASPGYCAGKAALSMGTLAIARREAKMNHPDRQHTDVRIWGYEPGFLVGTPMSEQNMREFGEDVHRMPDGRSGIMPLRLAKIILTDMSQNSDLRMCSMQRIDVGDQ